MRWGVEKVPPRGSPIPGGDVIHEGTGGGDGDFLAPTFLTEHSDAGAYFLVTASRTVYLVEIVSPDRVPVVTRYPRRDALLGDGVPLPGVRGFRFDITTGEGVIHWWKDSASDHQVNVEHYSGTVRRTSAVLLIARLPFASADPLSGLNNLPTREQLIAELRAAMLVLARGDL
jgi:hypothetical protein